jgi:hypothetical protein
LTLREVRDPATVVRDERYWDRAELLREQAKTPHDLVRERFYRGGLKSFKNATSAKSQYGVWCLIVQSVMESVPTPEAQEEYRLKEQRREARSRAARWEADLKRRKAAEAKAKEDKKNAKPEKLSKKLLRKLSGERLTFPHEIKARRQNVKTMYEQGDSLADMAKALAVSESTIKTDITALVDAGQLVRRPRRGESGGLS